MKLCCPPKSSTPVRQHSNSLPLIALLEPNLTIHKPTASAVLCGPFDEGRKGLSLRQMLSHGVFCVCARVCTQPPLLTESVVISAPQREREGGRKGGRESEARSQLHAVSANVLQVLFERIPFYSTAQVETAWRRVSSWPFMYFHQLHATPPSLWTAIGMS